MEVVQKQNCKPNSLLGNMKWIFQDDTLLHPFAHNRHWENFASSQHRKIHTANHFAQVRTCCTSHMGWLGRNSSNHLGIEWTSFSWGSIDTPNNCPRGRCLHYIGLQVDIPNIESSFCFVSNHTVHQFCPWLGMVWFFLQKHRHSILQNMVSIVWMDMSCILKWTSGENFFSRLLDLLDCVVQRY